MSVTFKMEGFDAIRRKLDTLQRRIGNLPGPVAFEDLFPPEFMRRHTDCHTVADLFAGSRFAVASQQDFDALTGAELDELVRAKTRFESWEAMKAKAGEEYVERRLDLENL